MKRVSDLESKETLGKSHPGVEESASTKDVSSPAPKVVGLFKPRAAQEPSAECGPPPLFASPPPGSEPEVKSTTPHGKAVGNFLLWRAKGLPPLTTGDELPDDTVYVGPLNKLPSRSDSADSIREIDPDFLAEEIKAKRKEKAKERIAGLASNLTPATTDSEASADYQSWRQALAGGISSRRAAARWWTLSAENARYLSSDPEVSVREAVAGNPSCPAEALGRLAQDRVVGIRKMVASNLSTTPELLVLLAYDVEDSTSPARLPGSPAGVAPRPRAGG